MNKIQKYIIAGILILVLALLGLQYNNYNKQITRHENAVKFWTVEVAKVQKQFPDFKPLDSKEMIQKENKQFAKQKKNICINSGLIVISGALGATGVYFFPQIYARLPKKAKK